MDVSDLFEKPVSPAIPQAEALARWFAGSKIVDDEGRPLRLYHGTSKDKDFAHFNVPKRGAWFTSDPMEASNYARDNESMKSEYDWPSRQFIARNTASRVIPVFVRATNPAVFGSYPKMIANAQNYARVQGDWMTGLRAAGHDAVVVQLGDGIKHVIVLGGPHQIKSAIGNKTFNPIKRGMNESRLDESMPRTLYHGTLRAHVPSIMSIGLQPSLGEFTRRAYDELDEAGIEMDDLVFAADRQGIRRCVSAIIGQLRFKGIVPTTDNLARFGAVVVLKHAEDDFERRADRHDDDRGEHPPTVEPGDYYSYQSVRPDFVIMGKRLVAFLRRHVPDAMARLAARP